MGIEWLFIQVKERILEILLIINQIVFSPIILVQNPTEASPNPLTNNETMEKRPKTPILNVYSRKKRSIITSLASIVNLETSNKNNKISPPSTLKISHLCNLDLPISFRKEVWACTHYLMSHFVSMQKFSPPYQTFLSRILSQ